MIFFYWRFKGRPPQKRYRQQRWVKQPIDSPKPDQHRVLRQRRQPFVRHFLHSQVSSPERHRDQPEEIERLVEGGESRARLVQQSDESHSREFSGHFCNRNSFDQRFERQRRQARSSEVVRRKQLRRKQAVQWSVLARQHSKPFQVF